MLLYYCSNFISNISTIIRNPDDWKKAYITPIFKSGNHTCPRNYRPISLTSIISKVMENILASNIMHHLDANFILSETQHSFHHNRSCETQLTSLLYDLTYTFDQRIQTDMVILDFAKAFDTVPHRHLLYKLDWYGIRENTHKWISTFLTNRTQNIVINNTVSSSCFHIFLQ